ncbi:pyridoxamine 5'-phosphate oxidase family protein [Streptomyces sp. WAC00263]|uniref:pyridoxamine 5'-phosphate oxidase family protein n=1 Tax=Streptomyces sp. WAC00263 TaxID=1917422 RepID=UPI0015EFCA58|nr:pyridoxamine 5'-phosphate oxidase family protein [Streptomyces sp. WAC00263]KAF5999207.1 pyridoxamine 5'-phosphate oxidase [Streptomyces sp. WAC00263]
MNTENDLPAAAGPRHRVKFDGAEALRLLGSVSLGRIVFTRHALPTIRPVNHVLVDGDIVIRIHDGAALTAHTRHAGAPGVVVAYEADAIDPDTHLGWSVVATGYARLVTAPREVARYRAMLQPWVSQTMDYAVRIRPELVTGIRLVAAPQTAEEDDYVV